MSSEMNEVESRSEAGEERTGRGRCGGRSKLWFIPLVILAILAKGALVLLLWNALIPHLFHGPEIHFLEAIGLLVLAKVLVGGKGHHGGPFGRGGFGRHRAMKRRFWAKMSEEERCELRDHLRKRWKE